MSVGEIDDPTPAVDEVVIDVVAAGVIDGPQSRVWDEAENRLHIQKAIMAVLMGGEKV